VASDTDYANSVHWIKAKVDTASANSAEKSVYVYADNSHAVGKQFTCRLLGAMTGSSGLAAYSQTFTLEFSPCGVPDYC
jgi:hypothetical protein